MSLDGLFFEQSKPFYLTIGKYYALLVSTGFYRIGGKLFSNFPHSRFSGTDSHYDLSFLQRLQRSHNG